MAASYAYNNYRPFDYDNTDFTQSTPYVLGSKNTKTYSGIPHKTIVNSLGMTINSSYLQNIGSGIKRIEGQGNGGSVG